MTGTYAKVIQHSINNKDVRLITLELQYPRLIHGQVMTHRVFSRGGRSSRAVPAWKVIDEVERNPVVPCSFGANQRGMQEKDHEPLDSSIRPELLWIQAAQSAAEYARIFEENEYHKQVVNRLTEPFQYMKLIVTSTEWDNFFRLRAFDDPQPDMRKLANMMLDAVAGSKPVRRRVHAPYGIGDTTEELINTSVAGCARVSYDTHDGTKRTVEKDSVLYQQLLKDRHMGPFEHQAWWAGSRNHKGFTSKSLKDGSYWSNNFREWIQHRALV